MVLLPVKCPHCHDIDLIVKTGTTSNDKQRFMCQNTDCKCKTFIIDYDKNGYLVATKKKITEMALNGSGIRDTARVLGISTNTVLKELKKKKNYCSQ